MLWIINDVWFVIFETLCHKRKGCKANSPIIWKMWKQTFVSNITNQLSLIIYTFQNTVTWSQIQFMIFYRSQLQQGIWNSPHVHEAIANFWIKLPISIDELKFIPACSLCNVRYVMTTTQTNKLLQVCVHHNLNWSSNALGGWYRVPGLNLIKNIESDYLDSSSFSTETWFIWFKFWIFGRENGLNGTQPCEIQPYKI